MRTSSIYISATTSFLGLLAGFVGLTFTPCFAESDTPPSQDTTGGALEAQVTFTPALRDILKMVDAKVDPNVIKAYIKNAPIAYNPTASEIIALKQHGVPDELIATVLERGGEVRTQFAQAATQSAPAAPSATPVEAPT